MAMWVANMLLTFSTLPRGRCLSCPESALPPGPLVQPCLNLSALTLSVWRHLPSCFVWLYLLCLHWVVSYLVFWLHLFNYYSPSVHTVFGMMHWALGWDYSCLLLCFDSLGKAMVLVLVFRSCWPKAYLQLGEVFVWSSASSHCSNHCGTDCTWGSVTSRRSDHSTFCIWDSLFVCFLVLGIEPEVLCMPGKHSATELHPKPQDHFVYVRGQCHWIKNWHTFGYIGKQTLRAVIGLWISVAQWLRTWALESHCLHSYPFTFVTWSGYLIDLCFNFPICKVEVSILYCLYLRVVVMKIKWVHFSKMITIVPDIKKCA
jgi:hypothetical protein